MIDSSTKDVLSRVLSDAHVVDIDMSHWGKLISLWVLADHFREWHDRKPLVIIDLFNIRRFNVQFNPAPIGLADGQHAQWIIYRLDISYIDNYICLNTSGHSSSPYLIVECETVKIREVPLSLLDTLQPNWNQPYSPFARRNAEDLVRRLTKR